MPESNIKRLIRNADKIKKKFREYEQDTKRWLGI